MQSYGIENVWQELWGGGGCLLRARPRILSASHVANALMQTGKKQTRLESICYGLDIRCRAIVFLISIWGKRGLLQHLTAVSILTWLKMTWIGAWFFQKFWDAYGAVDALPDACPLGFLTLFISALAPWSATFMGTYAPPSFSRNIALFRQGQWWMATLNWYVCVKCLGTCIKYLLWILLRYLFRY